MMLKTLITAVMVFFVIMFNEISIDLHVNHLKFLFQQSNLEENNMDHIGLVMNYKINKKLYDDEISQADANIQEARVNTILTNQVIEQMPKIEKFGVFRKPVSSAINLFRTMLGKPALVEIGDNFRLNDYLTLAYYYERNKEYKKALGVYEEALREETMTRSQEAGIILHIGFCNALLGNYQNSKKNYHRIIKDFSDEGAVVTAVILLRYLEGFNTEIERILKDGEQNVVKSEKLYKLLAYRESIKVLDSIEAEGASKDRARIRFLKGRCQEELGEKDSALLSYQTLIEEEPQSEFAKLSNGRIFIMGTRELGASKIKELAIKNNEILNDENFNRMLQESYHLSKDKPDLESDGVMQTIYKDEAAQSARVDQMMERVEEKKAEQLEKQIGTKSNKGAGKQVLKKKPRVEVHTSNGDVFVGELSRDGAKYMTIDTAIGKMMVDKHEITRIIWLK